MLKFLRSKTKIIVGGIIVLIIPAFVLWGVSSAIISRRTNFAGKLFNQRVSVMEYNNSFQACQINAIIVHGDNYKKIAQYLNLSQQAWERLILIKEAKKQKIKVSNEELINQIHSYPFFQHEGIFSKEKYHYILARVFSITPENYEKIEKENIRITKLIGYITNGILLSEKELFLAYKELKTNVKAKYILINAAEFEDKIKVTEEKAKEFFENNKSMFQISEQRKINFIKLPFSDFKTDITENEIKNFYESNLNLFKDTEKEIEKKAEAETETEAKETEENTEEKKETTAYKPLSEVKTLISTTIIRNKQKALAFKVADEIVEELLDNKNIYDSAKNHNVTAKETNYFFRETAINEITLEDSPIIAGQTFKMELGASSDIIEGNNTYYIIQIKDIKPPSIPDLNQVKDKVDQTVKKQLSYDLAKTAAQNFKDKTLSLIQQGKTFDQAISELGLTSKETEPFNLGAYIKDIGYYPSVNRAAFSLDTNQLSDVLTVDSGCLFLTPTEKSKITRENFEKDENLKEFKQNMLKKKKNLVSNTWFKDLERKANLSVNSKIFKK